MFVVVDIETEGLRDCQKIWVAVLKDIDTNKTQVFRNLHEDPSEFLKAAKDVSVWIGHNVIHFDLPVLCRLTGLVVDPQCVVDTLVVSRLLNAGIEGGHSLDAWGQRLGCLKSHFNDWTGWSQQMEDYCVQDVEVTHKLYNRFKNYIHSDQWKAALRLEHDIAFICRDMHENGFAFDIDTARKLHEEIDAKVVALDEDLVSAFPPRSSLVREVTPRGTKHGTISRVDFRWLDSPDLTPFSVGVPFSLVEFTPFNPGSPKQIVERLNEAGWKPFEKTKGHIKAERELKWCRDKERRKELEERLQEYAVYGWSISEANLLTLPETAPEAARKLVQRLLLASRRSTLETWITAFNDQTRRIHGEFKHIGAWTQRMSHSNPNMANVPSGETPYANQMRSLWTVPPRRLLVGVDADGIQLRILAHYMNDPVFTEALVRGDKANGTDAHSLNREALGRNICQSRDDAKTFIYAFLLGAGVDKVAQILGCSREEAKVAVENFIEAYPGLFDLKTKQVPRDAERGYFIGLDGRLVLCDSEHLMLAGYLQAGESVVMKRANVLWRNRLQQEKVPFWQVNYVHDEWQTETVDDMDTAKYIAEVQADSIRVVGEQLKLNCPLAGSIINSHGELAIGLSWSQTH